MKIKQIYINNEKSNYIINSNGDIYNIRTHHAMSSSSTDKDGYPLVTLSHKGMHYTEKFHRLVATYFVENPCNKPEVHHKDGDVSNFKANNLIWCTKKEHFELERKRIKKFNRAKGETHGNSKYSDDIIKLAINDLINGCSRQYVCEKYNIKYETIHRIYNKQAWCHLTSDIVFKKLNNPVRDIYSDDFKDKLLILSRHGHSPRSICKILNIEYTEKMRNYIKTFIRRNKKQEESSTTIENDEYYTIDIH